MVAPAVSGTFEGSGVAPGEVDLTLRLRHRESPSLYHDARATLAPDGTFAFPAVRLAIAGHEYSKVYRVHLHARVGGADRVVWRAEFSRRLLGDAIRLTCDLERPGGQGQPCQILDPASQPWLLAQGERTFVRLCTACHASGGSDREVMAAGPGVTPPDLRTIAVRRSGRFDPAEISEWIEGRSIPDAHGTRQMPVWGERLSEKYAPYVEGDALMGPTLDALVAYLASVQEPPLQDR